MVYNEKQNITEWKIQQSLSFWNLNPNESFHVTLTNKQTRQLAQNAKAHKVMLKLCTIEFTNTASVR